MKRIPKNLFGLDRKGGLPRRVRLKRSVFFLLSFLLFSSGALLLWGATLQVPDLSTLNTANITQSTKIYDRTGEILLYDIHENVKRTVVPLSEVSTSTQQATVAIEDSRFYEHVGVDAKSVLRAIFVNITGFGYRQGGSTITQQVAKNAFLSPEKTITRKLKEWIIAIKMERVLSKDEILELYFNEVPYGGNIYGVEEAARAFFGKHAKDLNLVESAYLAAIPQAPSHFSPYGNNRTELEERKNLVLSRMAELGYITKEEVLAASAEQVDFLAPEKNSGITAPHFVLFVKQYLEEKYGADVVETGGLKVVTTLDADKQVKTEEAVHRFGPENEKSFNAHNAAAVGIDPKTGQILVMVGSRDYFNKEIDGNFNVAIAPNRQPGSSFKPFVYATAFMKGYTPNTVLFDLPTEFNSSCDPYGRPINPNTNADECYMPENYDHVYRGPITLRDALAQSVNIPAVKLFYLAGVSDSIETAKKLGITTLGSAKKYGLTLVLGSGEVSLLEMTNAYSVFANNGIRNPYSFILKVEDKNGDVLEERKDTPEEVLPKDVALQISSILSDNVARAPAFGGSSALSFPGRDVAVKTGTSNDYRDVWIVGYTPSFALGMWSGNNDASPMEKKVAGFIVAPMWHTAMEAILQTLPDEKFEYPNPTPENIKSVLRGGWQSGQSYFTDKISGKLATEHTPPELRVEHFTGQVHTILYSVDKNDPLGAPPSRPENDSQFNNWETPIRNWVAQNNLNEGGGVPITQYDDIHRPEFAPQISVDVSGGSYLSTQKVIFTATPMNGRTLSRVDFYINDNLVGSVKTAPWSFSFLPSEIESIEESNTLRVVAYDSVLNRGEYRGTFLVTQP